MKTTAGPVAKPGGDDLESRRGGANRRRSSEAQADAEKEKKKLKKTSNPSPERSKEAEEEALSSDDDMDPDAPPEVIVTPAGRVWKLIKGMEDLTGWAESLEEEIKPAVPKPPPEEALSSDDHIDPDELRGWKVFKGMEDLTGWTESLEDEIKPPVPKPPPVVLKFSKEEADVCCSWSDGLSVTCDICMGDDHDAPSCICNCSIPSNVTVNEEKYFIVCYCGMPIIEGKCTRDNCRSPSPYYVVRKDSIMT